MAELTIDMSSKSDIKHGPLSSRLDDDFNNFAHWAFQYSSQTKSKQQHLVTRFSSKPKAMTIPKIRKKAFSHKTHTGCDTCTFHGHIMLLMMLTLLGKRGHIKCGEERPVCEKCRKGRFSCHYNTPKAWVFEPCSQDSFGTCVVGHDALDCSNSTSGLPTSIDFVWGSPEERRSLQYWSQFTGPWLAHYACVHDKKTWEVVFPRVAYTLPATRHLLVAIAMLDERLQDPSPEILMSRSRKILHHYNQAIHQLTLHNPNVVDTIASSLLAWVLETCLHDTTRAIMHLDASSRLLEKVQQDGLRDDGTEYSDIILNHLKQTRDSCAGYCSTERLLARPQFRDQTCIFTILVARHGPQQITSTRDAREVLEKYFAKFESPQGMEMSAQESRNFLRSWELTLLKYRHTSTEPHVCIVALHLLLNLALTLLPGSPDSSPESTPQGSTDDFDSPAGTMRGYVALSLLPMTDDESWQESTQNEAMEYVLHRAAELLSVDGLNAGHRMNLEQTISLVLQMVIRYDSEGTNKERALQMMGLLSV